MAGSTAAVRPIVSPISSSCSPTTETPVISTSLTGSVSVPISGVVFRTNSSSSRFRSALGAIPPRPPTVRRLIAAPAGSVAVPSSVLLPSSAVTLAVSTGASPSKSYAISKVFHCSGISSAVASPTGVQVCLPPKLSAPVSVLYVKRTVFFAINSNRTKNLFFALPVSPSRRSI